MTLQSVIGAPASDAAAPASAERAPVTTLCIRCHQSPWVGDRTHMCEACIEVMANIQQDDGDPLEGDEQ